MASTGQSAARRSVVATLVVLLVLLLLVGALAALNYMVRRPAAFQETREGEREFLFSIYGSEGDLLRRPAGVTVSESGDIYVADTGKRRIVVFNEDGELDGIYGNPGQGELDLWNPIDVAVAQDGRSYVVDKSKNKIVMYDATRMATRAITFAEEPPISVEVAGDELIVTTASGILIGTLDGELQTGYVARGKEQGQFDMPGGVTVDEDGTIYVADSLNYRVQALGTDGAIKWAYGEPLPPGEAIQFGDETRKFGLPADIALDEAGFLYVVDGTDGEIKILEAETGEFVEQFGDVGHEDGFFYYPDAVAYMNGRLVVADTFNDRVEVFRVPVPGGAFGNFLPFAPGLLVPLLLLLLIPIFRRRSNVMTEAFAARMQADVRGPEVAKALRKVTGRPELVAAHEGDFEDLKWVAKDPDAERVRRLMEERGLTEADASALDIVTRARGRKVLLTDDAQLDEFARGYGIATVTYEAILETLGEAEEVVAEEVAVDELPAPDSQDENASVKTEDGEDA